eukprot:COSAG02_NODE_947_length_15716_cov_7.567971_14_plen_56_part_00
MSDEDRPPLVRVAPPAYPEGGRAGVMSGDVCPADGATKRIEYMLSSCRLGRAGLG